eukprot:1458123-Rhodomonas_salina.1
MGLILRMLSSVSDSLSGAFRGGRSSGQWRRGERAQHRGGCVGQVRCRVCAERSRGRARARDDARGGVRERE